MTRKSFVFILGSLLFLSSSVRSQEAQDPGTFDLRIRAQSGDTVESELTAQYRLDLKTRFPGSNDVIESSPQGSTRLAATHEILEAGDNGAVRKERREYRMPDPSDTGAASERAPLVGSLLVIQSGDGDAPCSVTVEESDGELPAALTGVLQPLWSDGCLAPAKPVALNGSWNVDADHLRPLLAELITSMEMRGSFTATGGVECALQEVTETDSMRTARISFKGEITIEGNLDQVGLLSISDASGSTEKKVTLTLTRLSGSLSIDVTRAVPAGFTLSCDLQMKSEQPLMKEMQLPDLTLDTIGNGTLEFSRTYTLKRGD